MYNFRIENNKVLFEPNSNLDLYAACLKTVGINGGVVLCEGRLVAFYCSYSSMVKPGFEATETEKNKINNFALGL